MELKRVLDGIDYTLLRGTENVEIKDIKYDSREVEEGDIFVALNGYFMDGHDFIPEAIAKKASAIVISKMLNIHGDVTVIKVNDTRLTLALLSKNYFGNPLSKLTLIGVTGTTGKTTTTHMIRSLLLQSDIETGLIGSIGAKFKDRVLDTKNTTPESYEIYRFLKEMTRNGITHVVMETSSQGFKMHRLSGITFDIGVLTNITSDHIGPGEHESHEEYVSCKRELFLNSKQIIVNNDSFYLEEVLKDVKAPITRYGIELASDLNATDIHNINDNDFFGTEFTVFGLLNGTFRTCIPGYFNIYNSLAAILVGAKLGLDVEVMKNALVKVSVRGRMETALVTPKLKVVIDYAHTEDSMKKLVETLKEYKPKRLVSIFGSGGNRPKERRYKIGEIIGGISDFSIITMDNPRFEEISSINEDIKVGLNKVNAKYIEISDRAEAIRYAIENAQEGDLILLVGKGHEEYQDIKGIKYYFNELDIIKEFIKN